jgi:two-component system osmolarity sensor histidine kinase EnvZ
MIKISQLIPRSLLSRFLIIIITPTVLAQLIATYIFYERHWHNVSSHMLSAFTGEVVIIAEMYKDKRIGSSKELKNIIKRSLQIKNTILRHKTFNLKASTPKDLVPLRIALADSLDTPVNLGYLNDKNDISIEIPIENNSLQIIASRKRLDNPTTYIFILWMTGSTAIMLVLSVLFARNQIRSITRLAEAAEKFGKGQPIDDFKPAGAIEVRKASLAFLQMKERITRQITKRTEMLAAVSHDLRTPLTRIKLQLAMMNKTKEIEELEGDVIEIEHTIQNYLDFARGDKEEKHTLTNVKSLLEYVIYGQRKLKPNMNIELFAESNFEAWLKQNAFKRMVNNIIENSSRYATIINITLASDEETISLNFEDNGPGVDPDKYDLVFKPFYRLEDSRNHTTGGTGLGLAIVKDIVSSHGGNIKLGKSNSLAGLSVAISIPL